MSMLDVHPPIALVREAVKFALAEDVGILGDISASLVPPEARAEAAVVAHSGGVLAGKLCADEVFRAVDPAISVEWMADDGRELEAGDVLARLEGPLASLLTSEQVAMNFLTHLSGIASLTRRFVRTSQNKTRIRDTRRTVPGLRSLEKAAVRAGGGVNHRGSLDDGIVMTSNHLSGLSIADAVRRARLRWPGRFVEVVCRSDREISEAIEAQANVLLLREPTPSQVESARHEAAGRCLIEVHGVVDIREVAAFAEAGADFISVASLTQSAPVLDIRVEITPQEN